VQRQHVSVFTLVDAGTQYSVGTEPVFRPPSLIEEGQQNPVVTRQSAPTSVKLPFPHFLGRLTLLGALAALS